MNSSQKERRCKANQRKDRYLKTSFAIRDRDPTNAIVFLFSQFPNSTDTVRFSCALTLPTPCELNTGSQNHTVPMAMTPIQTRNLGQEAR